MNRFALMIAATCFSLSAYSGIPEDMDDFFKSSGMQTNLSGPGAYQGQTAGLYTGGQLYARNQVKMIYPANIELPAFSAGCGGIDAFTGAFSFISGKELVNSMESIASSAASYAFLLGMETFSPQMSGVQKHLSNIANAVNRANINSCEAASSLVGGMWPKTEVAQNHICTAAGSNGGPLSDWASAKQACASGKMTSTLSGKSGEKYKDMIVVNKNLAWETIKKNNYFGAQDTELKELMMSISGTVIIKNGGKDDSPNTITYKHSIVKDMSFIKALLYGG
jgi:conjugative transfer pilus assembly protein TraH